MCENDPNTDLLSHLKGSKLSVVWPHTRPEPTGIVRTKLIHNMMHKEGMKMKPVANLERAHALRDISAVWAFIVTIPAVAFSLYIILRWFEFSVEKAKVYAIIGGLAGFFAELGLTIIHAWKDERRDLLQEKRSMMSATPRITKMD